MKRIILFTVMLPVLIGCSIDRNELPDTPSGHVSSSMWYCLFRWRDQDNRDRSAMLGAYHGKAEN